MKAELTRVITILEALLETHFSPRQIVLVTFRQFLQPFSRVRAQLRVKPVTLLKPGVRQSCL